MISLKTTVFEYSYKRFCHRQYRCCKAASECNIFDKINDGWALKLRNSKNQEAKKMILISLKSLFDTHNWLFQKLWKSGNDKCICKNLVTLLTGTNFKTIRNIRLARPRAKNKKFEQKVPKYRQKVSIFFVKIQCNIDNVCIFAHVMSPTYQYISRETILWGKMSFWKIRSANKIRQIAEMLNCAECEEKFNRIRCCKNGQ